MITTNGAFWFPYRLVANSNYSVAVLTPAAGQTCVVGNGNGAILADVNSLTVTCTDIPADHVPVGGYSVV